MVEAAVPRVEEGGELLRGQGGDLTGAQREVCILAMADKEFGSVSWR